MTNDDRLNYYDGTPSPYYRTGMMAGSAENGDPDVDINQGALMEAIARWRRGEIREALYQLEKAMDGHLHGLGDLRPEDLR